MCCGPSAGSQQPRQNPGTDPPLSTDPRWLEWTKRLSAAAQNGLAYNTDPFNVERYESIRAIATEMMAAGVGGDPAVIRDLMDREVGHATPKVDVRGVVIREERVLLVRERAEGLWSLPGGWADIYDTPSEATVREIYEESGYRTRAVKLLALYDRNRQGHPPMPFHAYKVFFLCELLGGEAATSAETDEVGFFPLDGLPPLSIGRVTETQIRRFFEHHRDPDLPTDFD
jgi:ADP-ribose pyrophosphatase YjhB (NUDIX family)